MDWATISAMVITLVTALFTGQGDVSDEQAELLNAVSPGLGTAFQTAVTAANGFAPQYVEWSADTTLLKSLGLLSPWGSVGGPLGNVTGFLANLNPWILIGGGLTIWWFFFKRGGSSGGDPRFWKKSSDAVPVYAEDDYLV